MPLRKKRGGGDANGDHLGLQQGPSARPQATALHPHGVRGLRTFYFQVASGNVVDDQTICATWDLPCRLTGRRDFRYVADGKLASTENMAYIHQRQGRFLTVLPRT